jgi:hypothetical protein
VKYSNSIHINEPLILRTLDSGIKIKGSPFNPTFKTLLKQNHPSIKHIEEIIQGVPPSITLFFLIRRYTHHIKPKTIPTIVNILSTSDILKLFIKSFISQS